MVMFVNVVFIIVSSFFQSFEHVEETGKGCFGGGDEGGADDVLFVLDYFAKDYGGLFYSFFE